jgi:hypothetical protein
MPPNTTYVGRPSKWGNPYKVGDKIDYGSIKISPELAVALYKVEVLTSIERDPEWWNIEELRGKNLCCWCALDQPCHADVLLKMANPNPRGNWPGWTEPHGWIAQLRFVAMMNG